jgi:hypothetical protein
MTRIKTIENKGTEAVKMLRSRKLKSGFPFMINAGELLTNQCYLEYPDGTIKLVSHTKAERNFHVIKELSFSEAQAIRQRYNFYI